MEYSEFIINVVPLISFIVAALTFLVAIPTLIFTIRAVCVTKKINKQQIEREENNYLLMSIVSPYNSIETDIMLLAQGTFNREFEKNAFDEQVLMDISKAKSYSLMTNNNPLFDYLDDLITGRATEKIGQLIEEYFADRNKIKVPEKQANGPSFYKSAAVRNAGKKLRTKFLARTRDLRDQTIIAIKNKL